MKYYSLEKIEICSTCEGKGKIEQQPEHCADDSYILIACKTCLGSGRLIVKTTREITPLLID